MSEAAELPAGEEIGIISRPQGHLADVPLQFRWEATRRHPYYVAFWESTLRYRQGEVGDDPEERMLRYVAHFMLAAIGAFGHPVNPATPYEDLDSQLQDGIFLSGAVQPMSLRAIAGILMGVLPPAELAVLGSLFMNAGHAEYSVDGDDERRSRQRLLAMSNLAQIPSPLLDSYPDAPLLYVRLETPQRTIIHDMEKLVGQWKRRRGIGERRVHTRKFPLYFEVWDLREGWIDGRYHLSSEHSFVAIAQRLRKPISTVISRYRSAFELITGRSFSPSVWARLLGPLKLGESLQSAEQILSAPVRHRLRSPVRRPVPASVVNPVATKPSAASVTDERTTADDQEVRDFLLDLEGLIARGLPNDEIARRLECDVQTVEYMCQRHEEFRQISD